MARRSKKKNHLLWIVYLLIVCLIGYYTQNQLNNTYSIPSYVIENIPEYDGQDYVYINNSEPYFTTEDLSTSSFEHYSDLDYLGRCGIYIGCFRCDLPNSSPIGIGHFFYRFSFKNSNITVPHSCYNFHIAFCNFYARIQFTIGFF